MLLFSISVVIFARYLKLTGIQLTQAPPHLPVQKDIIKRISFPFSPLTGDFFYLLTQKSEAHVDG
jgi:hypothetical protein